MPQPAGDVLPLIFPEPVVQPPARIAGRLAPTVAYASDLVTVYHGHAEDLMPSLPTESVDLVIADPPYGVKWQSRRRAVKFDQLHGDGDSQDERDVIRDVLAHAVRVVGQHRHLYVFGPDDVLDGLKVAKTAPMVWDKGVMGSGDVTAPWGPSFEPITFAVSKHRHAGETGAPNVPARMRKNDVLRFTRPTGRAVRHPSEKPVGLMRELVESSSRAGDLVLDPYAGSGATAVAAVLTGRRALVCEREQKWVDLTIERVLAAEALVARMADL